MPPKYPTLHWMTESDPDSVLGRISRIDDYVPPSIRFRPRPPAENIPSVPQYAGVQHMEIWKAYEIVGRKGYGYHQADQDMARDIFDREEARRAMQKREDDYDAAERARQRAREQSRFDAMARFDAGVKWYKKPRK